MPESVHQTECTTKKILNQKNNPLQEIVVMLLPSENVLRSLAAETARQNNPDEGGEGASSVAIAMALNLLATRERGGSAAIRAQSQCLNDVIQKLEAILPADALKSVDIQSIRQQIRQTIAAMGTEQDFRQLEANWRQATKAVESLVLALNRHSALTGNVRARISGLLSAWESGDLLSQVSSSTENTASEPNQDLDAERWTHYLRQRFNDPQLQLLDFRPLPGGYGKQTFLFDAKSRELNGSFVIRRDMAEPLVDNDCHRIHTEFRLIQAMRERGFPAPDALWLDTEHTVVPGGDFIVMRRSPGKPGGDVFGAQQAIPADLTETLANILARLHALPPMPELDNLADSISLKIWSGPLNQCVRGYLENWLAMIERESRLASPSIASLLGWLLANIPAADGSPVLLHGDIGFHNFLFDQRKLTAVLDWEFAHLGDPAEDLAYVRNSIGRVLDWDAFMANYRAAGGPDIDEKRLHFFQVWGHLRNACAGNLAVSKFISGRIPDLKMVLLPYIHAPRFLQEAVALVAKVP
jgi:aminoglycoside phosphotransferase (APT) family kinase protein